MRKALYHYTVSELPLSSYQHDSVPTIPQVGIIVPGKHMPGARMGTAHPCTEPERSSPAENITRVLHANSEDA